MNNSSSNLVKYQKYQCKNRIHLDAFIWAGWSSQKQSWAGFPYRNTQTNVEKLDRNDGSGHIIFHHILVPSGKLMLLKMAIYSGFSWIFPLKMVIFHRLCKRLPEGNAHVSSPFGILLGTPNSPKHQPTSTRQHLSHDFALTLAPGNHSTNVGPFIKNKIQEMQYIPPRFR